MDRPRVVPTRRHGRNWLHVCLPDGRTIAWYDREAARVNLLGEEYEEEALTALDPFLTGPVTVGPPPVPTSADLTRLSLHPDDDLAPNRPGEALLVGLDRDLDRDLGPARRLRPDPRRRELAAQQAVGDALDRVDGAGVHVLHSLPLPGGHRVHHLLIGPGGLYALHALYAQRRHVTVADPLVALGRRTPAPLLHRVRADADRAAHALTAEVRPVLVLVGAQRVTVTGPPRGVRVLTDADVPGLARGGGVLKPADVEALYAVARDRRTWSRV
ncbi:NERD domain-containing protein [Streptomyces sp. CNZ748]|uniref:NERD domain-containing protein n=1 Tax=Streptomyces sp. CNZ748 TaxID=2885160 RepID=UPI001E2D139F|nr:NERD domain-containing protein [Streptomyces sp. CNZ748]